MRKKCHNRLAVRRNQKVNRKEHIEHSLNAFEIPWTLSLYWSIGS
jgi:hypothetical protein